MEVYINVYIPLHTLPLFIENRIIYFNFKFLFQLHLDTIIKTAVLPHTPGYR